MRTPPSRSRSLHLPHYITCRPCGGRGRDKLSAWPFATTDRRALAGWLPFQPADRCHLSIVIVAIARAKRAIAFSRIIISIGSVAIARAPCSNSSPIVVSIAIDPPLDVALAVAAIAVRIHHPFAHHAIVRRAVRTGVRGLTGRVSRGRDRQYGGDQRQLRSHAGLLCLTVHQLRHSIGTSDECRIGAGRPRTTSTLLPAAPDWPPLRIPLVSPA